jgi:hypothetical protein
MLSPMRLLITAAGLAVVIIGSLLLLNWWMVSCGRLACDIKPAWAAAEASTPDSCPPDLKAAAADATWAKGIYDNLPTWREESPKTTGWFFADGSATNELVSGEGSRNDPDKLWEEAKRVLAAAPIAQPPRGAPHPAASHVETKAAVWMRQNKLNYAVAVINHPRGPCGEAKPDDQYTCTSAVRAILPVGTRMVVWWWSDRDGHMTSASYEGTAT